MAKASTHTGICQACGRRQAVHVITGMIAKHGYTTEYGFFNGTCGGSDHLPLELDTKVNVETIASLIKWAARQEIFAEAEMATIPIEVSSEERDAYGRRKKMIIQVGAEEYSARHECYGRFEDAVERVRYRFRRAAEIARADAADLERLRNKVHGQPLQERAVEAPIKREQYKTYREAHARVEELKAAGHKAQSRRGWGGFTVTYR